MKREELLPLCECGCGNPVAKMGNRVINGHQNKGKKQSYELISKRLKTIKENRLNPKLKPELQLCECGCGELAKPGNRFINGHGNRGKKLIMRNRRKNAKEKILIVCENCGFDFESCEKEHRRFCSHKCWCEWRSENERSENHPLYKERIIKICKHCGLEFESLETSNRLFCSKDCHRKWFALQYGDTTPAWKGGISFEPYCPKFNGELKQQIRDLYNNCDFFSGLPDYICNVMNGKVWELDIHHVDYNKMQGCDEHKWLLIPVSHKNHTKTNANRSFWERLICYALEYDETYYNDEIKDMLEMI